MPSESRPFDSAFENGTFGAADRHPAFGKPEAAPLIDDFNTFFEKLSALEETGWSDAQLGATGITAPAPQAAAASKASGKVSAKAPISRVAAGAGRPMAPPPAASTRRVPRAFKLAMTALGLFIVGMSVGWAALNLPQHLDRYLPSVAKSGGTLGWPSDPAAVAPVVGGTVSGTASETAGGTVGGTVGGAAVAATPFGTGSAGSDNVFEPIAPTAAAIGAGPAPAIPPKAQIAEQPAATKTKAPKPSAQIAQKAAPVPPTPAALDETLDETTAAGAPAASGPAATAAVATAKPAGQGAPAAGRSDAFALQVGACRSSACVDNFRRLITPHVDGKSVHVVASPAAAGVQRVRVEPLAKAQALELKQALALADARLKNAYVVRLTR